MTAREAPDTALRLAGNYAYVIKPVGRKVLVATIRAQIACRAKPKARGHDQH